MKSRQVCQQTRELLAVNNDKFWVIRALYHCDVFYALLSFAKVF